MREVFLQIYYLTVFTRSSLDVWQERVFLKEVSWYDFNPHLLKPCVRNFIYPWL